MVDTRLEAAPSRAAAFPTVSVVIPARGSRDRVMPCLETILAERSGPTREVIVVDDGADAEARTYLEQGQEALWLLRNDPPGDWAAACGEGAAIAAGRYLVFLASEAVPQPGWLAALADVAEANPQTGVVGPRVLSPSGQVQQAGLVFGPRRLPYACFRGAAADAPEVLRPREVQAVGGVCLLVRRELFETLGGFDGAYAAAADAFAAVDLCLRARERSFQVRYCPASRVVFPKPWEPGGTTDDRIREAAHHFLVQWGKRVAVDDGEVAAAAGVPVDTLRTADWSVGFKVPAPQPGPANRRTEADRSDRYSVLAAAARDVEGLLGGRPPDPATSPHTQEEHPA